VSVRTLGSGLFVGIAFGCLKGKTEKEGITWNRELGIANGVGIAGDGLCENFQVTHGHC